MLWFGQMCVGEVCVSQMLFCYVYIAYEESISTAFVLPISKVKLLANIDDERYCIFFSFKSLT